MTLSLVQLRQAASLYAARYDLPATARYVQAHCGQEVPQLLKQADDLLENRFVFHDRWDMEPCRTPYTLAPGQWTHSPNGDPEWVFMLNRHDYLAKLWQAAALTQDPRYTRKLVEQILDWIDCNPITQEGTPATRTIDTGIRCMNWVRLLPFLLAEGALRDQEAERILASLAQQFQNLRQRYLPRYTLSNWGVLQTTAICAGYAFLSDALPAGLEEWAWAELRAQLRLQILEDGAHWEQSPMYHVEVLNACVELLVQLRAAQQAGCSLCDAACWALDDPAAGRIPEEQAGPGDGLDFEAKGWLERAVRVMTRQVLYTADPGFFQLPQGDSDVTDVRDVLARAAALLPDMGLCRWAAGPALDLASAWLLGAPGIAAFEAQIPRQPIRRSWFCPRSGSLTLRSGWGPKANFTALKNGPLGSSHGHADQTHLTLYYKGQPFLVDSGRYSYREDEPLRTALKSPAAHNLCVIDGQSGGRPDGSWSYADYAETGPNYFAEEGGVYYAELPFHGRLEDGTPYQIIRRMMVLDEGVWLSVQDVICPGAHRVAEYFHLVPGATARPAPGGQLLCSKDAALMLYCNDPLTAEQGIVSPCYNETQESILLTRQITMQDRWTGCTLLAPETASVKPVEVYQAGAAQPLPREAVSAWEVRVGETKTWTLLVWTRETFRGTKVFDCQGRLVYGKAAALCTEAGAERMIRLK